MTGSTWGRSKSKRGADDVKIKRINRHVAKEDKVNSLALWILSLGSRGVLTRETAMREAQSSWEKTAKLPVKTDLRMRTASSVSQA